MKNLIVYFEIDFFRVFLDLSEIVIESPHKGYSINICT